MPGRRADLVPGCALWDAANGSDDDPADAGDVAQFDTLADDADSRDADEPEVVEADATDDVGADTAEEPHAFKSCLSTEAVYPLEVGAPKPQFHPRVAFDGHAIWVVYARGSALDATALEIFATRITCDSGFLAETWHVSTLPILEVDPVPSIDIVGGTVHMVWHSDVDTGAADRSKVAYRSFGVDGEPKMDAEVYVDFVVPGGGAGAFHDFYTADIVGLSEGEALIAAVSDDNIGGMRVVLQKVSQLGEARGQAVAVPSTSNAIQLRPSVAASASGPIWAAWLEAATDGLSGYLIKSSAFDRSTLGATEQPMTSNSRASIQVGPRHANGVLEDESVYFLQQADALAGRLYSANRAGDVSAFGSDDANNIFPSLASHGRGGAVAWFSRTNTDPDRQRQLMVQTFRDSGSETTMGVAQAIARVDAPLTKKLPGGPEIISIDGHYYFVVAQDGGTTSSTALKGRFVKLPAQADAD